MIAYFSLHQLGLGDITLPEPCRQDHDGLARVDLTVKSGGLVSHAGCTASGMIYYDAVSCYDENGKWVRLFATETAWITDGDSVTITASND